MTDGEQRVARALGPEIDTDGATTRWWQEPSLRDLKAGGDRRPDFVIFDAAYGLFVLEVKDWALQQIQNPDTLRWPVRKNGQWQLETAPAEQARTAGHVLQNLLRADSRFVQTGGKHQGKPSLPIAYGAVLANISREEARASGLLGIVAGQHYFFRDDLQTDAGSPTLADRLRDQVRPLFHFSPLDRDMLRALADVIEPQRQVSSIPDLRSEAERLLIERLDAKQKASARSLGEGHHILTGCAGSGKTLVVAARARFLKQLHPDWRVRILCFNAELVPYIYGLLGDVENDPEPKIVVQNFHRFARECVGDALQRNEREDDASFAHRTEQAFLTCAATVPEGGLFDALLIDEGQDLQADWTRALVSLVNPKTNSVLFAASRQQNIYGIKDYKNLGLHGMVTQLELSYRCSDEIIALAESFRPALLKSARQATAESELPLLVSHRGSRRLPQFIACADVGAVHRYISGEIKRYMNAGQCAFKDIAILYTQQFLPELEPLATALCNNFGPQHVYCKWKAGKSLMPVDDSIKLVTIHGSKGLGWRIVFVLGLDKVPRQNFDVEQERSLAYVALTRAEDEIHFVSLRDQGFHKDLKELSLTLSNA